MKKTADERLVLIGERLKSLREKHRLTQNDVAFQLSMDRTSISKYEHGILEPPIAVSRKFAKMYNISLDYLIGNDSTVVEFNDDGSDGDDVLPFANLTKNEKMLILKMRLMSNEEKAEIESFIENKQRRNGNEN